MSSGTGETSERNFASGAAAMPYKRKRELAQPEEPVGVACPLDVDVVSHLELEPGAGIRKVLRNNPVIDTVDGDESCPFFIVEPVPLPDDVADVDDARSRRAST